MNRFALRNVHRKVEYIETTSTKHSSIYRDKYTHNNISMTNMNASHCMCSGNRHASVFATNKMYTRMIALNRSNISIICIRMWHIFFDGVN